MVKIFIPTVGALSKDLNKLDSYFLRIGYFQAYPKEVARIRDNDFLTKTSLRSGQRQPFIYAG